MMINLKNMMSVLILLPGLLFGCENDSSGDEVLLPSNLSVNIEITDIKSGAVQVTASAQNVNFYRFYFGEDVNEAPEQNTTGKALHNYSSSGTYTVKVQAHTTDEGFISKESEVEILLNDVFVIPATGYTTPESYDGMTMVWSDEFSGSALNMGDWTFEEGRGHNGWGNNELQYYRPNNVTVRDGCLIIEARKESFSGSEYTSSRIITQGKQEFQYGRIDIRAVLPEGQGIWPALWMLGSNFTTVGWPASGEIDIMEMIGGAGRENTVHGTIHYDNNGNYANTGEHYTLDEGVFSDKFHVFSLIWTESSLEWYVDDVKFNTIDISADVFDEFRNSFFLIFNVAVGGNWPGSPTDATLFPQRMAVDYVRVFQNQ